MIDLILPPRCIVSGEIVAEQGTLASRVWQDLRFITPPFCSLCGYPFEFEAGADARCGACIAEAPPFTAARSALVYDDVSRELILKFKHGDHLQAVPTLAGMMARAGGDVMDGADVIVPVPLHRWRLLRRRYNQAALLAIALSRKTGVACVPDGLLRVRATESQGHMKAKDRADNVRKAFVINPKKSVAGKIVVLVDDVYTTGATVKECARALLQGGAEEVRILAVARVVRAEDVT